MFSAIDTRVIEKHQWVIRQIELFTPLTRKRFIGWLLNIAFLLISASLVLTILASFIQQGSISLILLVLLLFVFQWNKIIAFLGQKESQDVLPAEIKTRYPMRKDLSIALILAAIITPIEKSDNDIYLLVWILIILIFFIYYQIEYFLCTSSLSPGERERKGV